MSIKRNDKIELNQSHRRFMESIIEREKAVNKPMEPAIDVQTKKSDKSAVVIPSSSNILYIL